MFIEDGSDIDYNSKERKPGRYSWGWLGDTVLEGKCGWQDRALKKRVIKRLRQIVSTMEDKISSDGESYQQLKYCVHQHKGHHVCEVCSKDVNPKKRDYKLGWNGSILINYKSKEYRAPWAVVHYVNRHDYNPGAEVIDVLFNGTLVTYNEIDGEEWRQMERKREAEAKRKKEERQRIEDAKSPEQKQKDAEYREWLTRAAKKVKQLLILELW